MRVILRIATRDMLPDLLNRLAAQQGRRPSYEETAEVHLMLQREWESVPREGDGVLVHGDAAARTVENVWWETDGSVSVFLEDLDTDEIAGDEGLVLEELFQAGWEIDWEMMSIP